MCKRTSNREGARFTYNKWLASKRAKMYKIYEDTYKDCSDILSTQLYSYRLLFSGFTLMVTLLLRADASFSTLL